MSSVLVGAVITAKAIVFKPQGLRRWAWFRQAMDAGHIDRRVLLQEATSEVLLQHALGFDGEEAMRRAEAALRSQYRPQFDVGGGYPQHEEIGGRTHPRASDGILEVTEYGKVGRFLREHLTDRQWELLSAKADLGSTAEAASYCGSDKGNVARAARRAREILARLDNPGVLHHEMMIANHIEPAATEAAGSNTTVEGEDSLAAGRRGDNNV